jgi:DNA (cytosine-5)-methyltransferase 3A
LRVLSLFDGISCAQLALNRVGIKPEVYFASEIKPEALLVTEFNFPHTLQCGDVRRINGVDHRGTDLLAGGSPCQDLSIAMRNREGLAGAKSSLFDEYCRILDDSNPTFFILENVARMPEADKAVITSRLGVEPIRINSSLVSAQLRDRLYWTNIPTTIPVDRGILLEDILESGYTDRKKARALLVSDSRPLRDKARMYHRYRETGFTTIVFESEDMNPQNIRYFTQIELERLQTLPVGYTQILKRDMAAGVIGDAWTVDVIAHIFRELLKWR